MIRMDFILPNLKKKAEICAALNFKVARFNIWYYRLARGKVRLRFSAVT